MQIFIDNIQNVIRTSIPTVVQNLIRTTSKIWSEAHPKFDPNRIQNFVRTTSKDFEPFFDASKNASKKSTKPFKKWSKIWLCKKIVASGVN